METASATFYIAIVCIFFAAFVLEASAFHVFVETFVSFDFFHVFMILCVIWNGCTRGVFLSGLLPILLVRVWRLGAAAATARCAV